jgi:TonB family protein
MGELRLVPLSAYHIDCSILEVAPGASSDEIKQAYRDLSKVWHPDRFSNDPRLQEKAEERIKQINLAYRRLCGLSPYDQPVFSPSSSGGTPSDWRIAFLAFGRALRHSAVLISKPFRLLIGGGINITHGVLQWGYRERRSLAIATTAFILGVAFGVWLLPRDSEAWVKITGLLERTKSGGARAPVAQRLAAPPTVPPQTVSIASSSPATAASLPPLSLGAKSELTMSVGLTDVSSRKSNDMTPFPVSEPELTRETRLLHRPAEENDLLQDFGSANYPKSLLRDSYIPISFVPNQIGLYFAAPHKDFQQDQLNLPDATVVTPSEQTYPAPDRAISRQEPDETVREKDLHALGETSRTVTSQDDTGSPATPITQEAKSAERKKPAGQVTIKPLQSRRAPAGSVTAGSATKAVATYAPRPDYPEEARSRRISGNGVCVVSIDPYSGHVTNASMAQSTGSQILDKSVLRTLRTWKFKPGTMSQVSVPVEFATQAEDR